eukprot:TRINITY_DN33557_c0_g1_i1.p1 TRINITY_DN33557_c0_g1~~TRINITY_DN33557_c0_g1_i1.p1  ORF type:complete len:276 (+),score=49.35 TRINITY_DN33557_c0_g1_i1:74-829(+)
METSAPPPPPSLSLLEAFAIQLDDPMPFMRMSAVSALMRHGADATPHAAALAAHIADTDIAVRRTVARALQQLGSAGVEALAARLSDADPEVRQCAAAALGGCDRNSVSTLPPGMVRALRDSDASVRLNAVNATACLGAVAAPCMNELASLVSVDESSSVRQAAAVALGRMGTMAACHAGALTRQLHQGSALEVRRVDDALARVHGVGACTRVGKLTPAGILAGAGTKGETARRYQARSLPVVGRTVCSAA